AQDEVQRAERVGLTRRPLPRLPVERIGARGDLRAGIPGGEEQVASVARRRPRPVLEGRRSRALLPSAEREADGGADREGRHPRGRHAAAAVPGALRDGRRPGAVSALVRWPEIPGALAARPRGAAAGGGRAQLDVGDPLTAGDAYFSTRTASSVTKPSL